jgi:spore coat protein A
MPLMSTFARIVARRARLCVSLAAVVGVAYAANARPTVTLAPTADNTIYSENTAFSNGAGDSLFTGRTNNGALRRALVQFDTSSIPAGSTVTAVSLRLTMTRTNGGAFNVAAHRVTNSWGEGASNAAAQEGGGIQAQTNDATWIRRFYNVTSWTTVGGDFLAVASATTSVNGNGNYTWSSATLISDVQGWVNTPANNFGWIMRGNETTNQSAKRFASRQNPTTASRPQLTVTYTAPAASGACCSADGSCIVTLQTTCTTTGGTFQGTGTVCSPNPCPQPPGACCAASGVCTSVSAAACATAGGTFQGTGTTCAAVYCSPVLTPFVDALPIPGVAQPVTGVAGGVGYYEFNIREFTQQLHSALPATRLWGYNSKYPADTIECRSGTPITVKWINDLRNTNGSLRTTHLLAVDTCLHGPSVTGNVPFTVTHLHGLKVAPDSDGFPDLSFPPGSASPVYNYPNDQQATTLWYHDHALGLTRLNVYMGLAGFYLIRDAAEDALNLPRGQYEIPLVIQDRSFNADGSLRYNPSMQDNFFGDKILVNGKVWPFLNVNRGKYRFRLVNGSNTRTYTLSLESGTTTNIPFQQIGSDGGLLAAPATITSVTIQPGERADIVIDFAQFAATTQVTLKNSAPAPFPGTPGEGVIPNVMRFNVGGAAGDTDPLPASLVPVPRTPESQAVNSRDFTLRTASSQICGLDTWLIDDLLWDDITDFVRIGDTEIWSFTNFSTFTHPLHVHLVQFQILDRQNFNVVNNAAVPSGPRVVPNANELGWKDTVQCPPLQITRVIAKFEGFAGTFPMHCHILEHEDHEMMRQFTVTCAAPSINTNPGNRTIAQGASTTFTVAATGDLLTYQWLRNGTPLTDGTGPYGCVYSGCTTASMTISSATPANNAQYSCAVTGFCGSAPGAAANLTVTPACVGDLDYDGSVNTTDLTIFLASFGQSVTPGTSGDLNADGAVNTSDLTFFLARFGAPCAP